VWVRPGSWNSDLSWECDRTQRGVSWTDRVAARAYQARAPEPGNNASGSKYSRVRKWASSFRRASSSSFFTSEPSMRLPRRITERRRRGAYCDLSRAAASRARS